MYTFYHFISYVYVVLSLCYRNVVLIIPRERAMDPETSTGIIAVIQVLIGNPHLYMPILTSEAAACLDKCVSQFYLIMLRNRYVYGS